MNPSGPVKWKDPAVRAFCERTRCEDPVRSIKAEALALVARSGIVRAPFSPFILGSLKGVLRVKFEPIGFDACLIPMTGGFEVRICSSHPETRQTFSMAHEVGHLLMMDPASPLRTARRETNIGSGASIQEEEFLCDIAASELLLPSPFFEADAQVAGPSLSSVLDLTGMYKASLTATIRRLVASGLWRCFFLVWSIADAKRGPKLKLDQIVASRFQLSSKADVSLRDETRILNALETGNIIRGQEWLKFSDYIEDRYYLETIRIGSPTKPRLLSMVIMEPGAGRWSPRRKTTDPQLPLHRLW
jgi:hypothetical protein